MQPGSFPYSTNGAKGSKIYISSVDICKIECPYGTVPILTSYMSSMSTRHFYNNIGHNDTGSTNGYENVGTMMAAVETEPSTFYGSQSSISVWEPYLGTGRPPRYTGAVVVIQNGQSRIGAGWYVDPDMYGDNHTHFEIAWIWDVWVLLFGEELVGYWPGELFTDLSGAANMIGWMGVASAATGEPFPPMGSGYSPDEGEGRAAFFTDVKVIYSSTSKFVSPNLSEIFTSTTTPNCYQVGRPSSYDSGLHFYFGGAGCSPSQFIK
uniref:Neprosin PEP catalytic domain-containing protein n=1 Tax=Oryza glumipatula TaxID=40148 RepID=A0A0E0BHR5_9ORYZ